MTGFLPLPLLHPLMRDRMENHKDEVISLIDSPN